MSLSKSPTERIAVRHGSRGLQPSQSPDRIAVRHGSRGLQPTDPSVGRFCHVMATQQQLFRPKSEVSRELLRRRYATQDYAHEDRGLKPTPTVLDRYAVGAGGLFFKFQQKHRRINLFVTPSGTSLATHPNTHSNTHSKIHLKH